jgi:broad specificity phosphatase PhoE
MKIYAIRHGLTALNKKGVINGQIDEGLSDEGIKQAQDSIVSLPKNIEHIHVSPLLRTKQTAEIINKHLKKSLSIHDELREIHFGSFAGKAWNSIESGEELMKKHRAVKYDYRPAGGESVEDVKERLLQFLKKIKGAHGDYEVLLVTHGGIIRMLHMLQDGKVLDGIENTSLHEFDLDKIL